MGEEPLASARSEKEKGRNRHAPEHVHVEHLVPVIEATPRCAFGSDGGVVHEHTNLREEARESCEVIVAAYNPRRPRSPMETLRCRTDNGGWEGGKEGGKMDGDLGSGIEATQRPMHGQRELEAS